ncbi:exoribonuclease [Bacillus phage 015DV002]|nr:exoribonuclease [Bacillus phage 000TH009]QQO41159.1 exoribonuclease [Bacillus phage 015DV002]QQO41436.1 exoribonuclease [Bacillus phage 015DV004]
MTKVFFDFEFTGLHQNTTPISLGMVSDKKELYCEFTDYDKSQVSEWVDKQVIQNLMLKDVAEDERFIKEIGSMTVVRGDKQFVKKAVTEWLSQYKQGVELWGDTLIYDGVLFNELFGGAFSVPDNVYYIYFDIATLFKLHGIDPDISREAFIDHPISGAKHNALYDAKVTRACYDKLSRNREEYPVVF